MRSKDMEMETIGNAMSQVWRNSKDSGNPWASLFSGKFSPSAIDDLSSILCPSAHPAGSLLFMERDQAQGIYFVLEGEVKLSINSADGRRLNLSIARKGEILGLASALFGKEYLMTAETLYPCKLVHLGQRDLQGFLMRHADAYQTLTQELGRQLTMACEQLRTIGLSASVPEKLARLLLEWSEGGQTTDAGTRFRFSLTHEEIGEFIGASRETVTRTLSLFKTRHLVSFHGSTLVIPNRQALESFAHC
jgi:CRP/FNR family cyclic AMP-dependent transcriptional regulator